MNTPKRTPLLVPTKTKDICTITRLEDAVWHELETIFRDEHTRRPLYFLPPEAYLETLFGYACKNTSLPSASGTVYNLQFTIKTCLFLKPDCIISNTTVLPFLLNAETTTRHIDTLQTIVLVDSDETPSEAHPTFKTDAKIFRLTHPLLDHA